MNAGLLAVAVLTLEDPNMSAALKAVATDALVVAVREGLPLPSRAAWAMWLWIKTLPANTDWRSADALGDVPDERVRADALGVLDRGDAGTDLKALALEVLGGLAHAAHVPDAVVLREVERAAGVEIPSVMQFAENVHKARPFDPEVLRHVRQHLHV